VAIVNNRNKKQYHLTRSLCDLHLLHMEFYICGYLHIMIKGFAGKNIPHLYIIQRNIRKC